jgi:hypothetical protein
VRHHRRRSVALAAGEIVLCAKIVRRRFASLDERVADVIVAVAAAAGGDGRLQPFIRLQDDFQRRAAVAKKVLTMEEAFRHRLNMELDLQSLLGCCEQQYSLAETPQLPPTPPAFENAIGQSRYCRRHFYVNPLPLGQVSE